jgi:Trypsin-like peptidase domain
VRLGGGLSAIFLGTAIGMVQIQIANALTPAEVAQQVTVRIGGANTGSGVIIEHEGNNYTVVTNWHVLQVKGNYTVFMQDGRQYSINQIKQLPNVDLAIFQFTSNQNYQVAQKGDSDQVTLGKSIYVAGFPQGTSDIQFLSGTISSIRKNPENGYALVYAVNAFPGMSGGPIIDEQGKLIGIHGRAETRPDTNATTVLGIPLKTYLSLIPNKISTQARMDTSLPKPVLNQKPQNSSVPTSVSRTQVAGTIRDSDRFGEAVDKIQSEAQRIANIARLGQEYKYGNSTCQPKERELTLIAFSSNIKEKKNQLLQVLPPKLILIGSWYQSIPVIQIRGLNSSQEVQYWQKYLKTRLNISSFTGTCTTKERVLHQVE